MKDYKEAIESIMKDTTSKVIDHAIKAYHQGYENGLGKAQTDSYVKGYVDGKADTPFTDTDEAYNRGLNEAWEAARKLGAIPMDDYSELFETKSPYFDFSVQEVLAKIKEYEDKQKQEQFAIGDEVYSDAFDDKGIITHITEDNVSCVCIICNGSTMMKVGTIGLHKTGRHFPQIAEVLKQMNREEDK